MSHAHMNCYEILEVSQNASQAVIKAAYKSLMQRYHPDKHPGDAEIAAHASKVVQAYEVLSDPTKKAAYDIKLKQQAADSFTSARDKNRDAYTSAARKDPQASKEHKSYWLLWLLITLTIILSLSAMSILKTRQSLERSNRADEIPSALGTPGTRTSEGMKDLSARTIPAFISDVKVELGARDGFSGEPARILNIPVLGVTVGTLDSEEVLRYIDNNKGRIRQKLEERLAAARYDELIKNDGEQYLKNIIVNSIGNTIGTNRYQDNPEIGLDAPRDYGVVDVLLPRSFSVH
jgi:curved DNA-binding protein CbpA